MGLFGGYERDQFGLPVLRDSLVLFLDLLGVSNLATGSTAATVLRELDPALTAAREYTKTESGYHFAWFSDCLAIAFPISTWHVEDEFGDVLRIAQRVQFTLAIAGFVSRGGFSRGDMYMDDKITFGSALVDAVALEKTASTPRVLLSDHVVQTARSHLKFYGDPPTGAPQHQDLSIDPSDNAFINYLRAAEDYYSGDDVQDLKPLLDQHRDVVIKGLADHPSGTAVRQKYEWLAQYHNWYCETIGLVGSDVASDPAAAFRRFI